MNFREAQFIADVGSKGILFRQLARHKHRGLLAQTAFPVDFGQFGQFLFGCVLERLGLAGNVGLFDVGL